MLLLDHVTDIEVLLAYIPPPFGEVSVTLCAWAKLEVSANKTMANRRLENRAFIMVEIEFIKSKDP